MFMLEELIKEVKEEENEIQDRKVYSLGYTNILNNYNYNKNYYNWRPQGQIITTLYDHNTIPVEKLVPLNNETFCSFDNCGNAILYNINIDSDDEIIMNKKWEYKKSNKDKEELLYKNSISSLDNSSFVLSFGNNLYQYNPNVSQNKTETEIKLCTTKDESNISCVLSFGFSTKENQKILFCNEKGSINLYDNRVNNKISLHSIVPKQKGTMYCISESFENNQFLLGTLDGCLLKYDLRLNTLVKDFKYCYDRPILGIKLYNLSNLIEYELNANDKNSQYIILWTGSEEHEISFWNYYQMDCDLLLTLNIQNNGEDELDSSEVEVPYLENNCNDQDIFDYRSVKEDADLNTKIKAKFKKLNKYTQLYYYNNAVKRYFSHPIQEGEYKTVNNKLNNLSNLYGNPSTVQSILSPYSDYSLIQNHYFYENTPYIISAGNDSVIRYWDISKDFLNSNCSKKSYVINAPNNIDFCQFTKSVFDTTTIIQSNEIYNSKEPKINMPGLSEFQNFNGILYHSSIQDEFDENDDELKYCTKITDPSHKSIITDLLPLSIEGGSSSPVNLLVSSSWDGTVKIWK